MGVLSSVYCSNLNLLLRFEDIIPSGVARPLRRKGGGPDRYAETHERREPSSVVLGEKLYVRRPRSLNISVYLHSDLAHSSNWPSSIHSSSFSGSVDTAGGGGSGTGARGDIPIPCPSSSAAKVSSSTSFSSHTAWTARAPLAASSASAARAAAHSASRRATRAAEAVRSLASAASAARSADSARADSPAWCEAAAVPDVLRLARAEARRSSRRRSRPSS